MEWFEAQRPVGQTFIATVGTYLLAGAIGAMLYVVVEQLILETVRGGTIDVATLGFIGGFAVMMALDNALQ